MFVASTRDRDTSIGMPDPTWTYVAVLGVAALVALDNWRAGLLLVIPVGFLQDPLRKLAAGQPVFFLTMAAGVFAIVFATLWARGAPLRLSYIYGRDRGLRHAWVAFITVVVAQSAHTLFRYRSPIVCGLGLANYLAPMASLMAAFLYACDEARVWRFARLYAACAVPCCLTVYLSYWFGGDWDILKDIGAFSGREMLIYAFDTVFYSYPGIFRVGEIAAWHAATASAVLIILATNTRSPSTRAAFGLLVIALVGAVLLTGRRKMLMALTLFVASYASCFALFWGEMKRLTGFIVAVALAGTVVLFRAEDDANLYVRRGMTVFEEVDDRLTMALDLFDSALHRQGLFGAGAGVAAQGTQYYQPGAEIGGAAESGLGRIATELGLPGLVVGAWLLVSIVRHLTAVFRRIPRTCISLTPLMAGWASLVLANAATFLVATQLYGDLFILIFLGLCSGFLFAGERLVGQRPPWRLRGPSGLPSSRI